MTRAWPTKKLGEVCEIINRGVSPKYTSSQGVCVLNQKCIRNHKINFDLSRIHDIKNKKINSEKLIQIGDVLVNSTGTGTLGRVAQVKELLFEATVDSHITIVRPQKNRFYNAFFGYAIIFIEEEISKRANGCGGQTELARNTLKNDFTITYPESISEQQLIATILDEAFSAITAAKKNTEKNLKNANELLQSYINDIFTQTNNKWTTKKLSDISKINYGYTEKASFKEIGPRFLRITDIQGNNVNWETVPFCNIEKNELLKYQLNEDDIVFARTGATTGKSFLIKSPPLAVFASYLIRLKILNSNELISEFLFLFFQTKTYWDNIQKRLSGSAQGGFNASKLSEMEIPIPSLHEQQCIIANFSALYIEIKKLEVIYQKKITNLEKLKKSILQKAFSGELTQQDANIPL